MEQNAAARNVVVPYEPQEIAGLIESRKLATDGDERIDRLLSTIMLIIQQHGNVNECYAKQRMLLAALLNRQGGSVSIRGFELARLPAGFKMQVEDTGEAFTIRVVEKEKVLVL